MSIIRLTTKDYLFGYIDHNYSVKRVAFYRMVKLKMEIDPRSVLLGAAPCLLDEWQEYPQIWNYVRREVDERKQKGQFILTGSATPDDKAGRWACP